ncbi:MAG TPA: MarR family transcriptional regulator [Planktothrix sp.]
MDAALAAVDLSRAKLGVLHNLVEAGEPITQTQLANMACCVKSNITNLIDRMQGEGLVERLQDGRDRRSVHLLVTKEGKRLYNQGMRIISKEETKMLKNLDSGERDMLANFLSRLE